MTHLHPSEGPTRAPYSLSARAVKKIALLDIPELAQISEQTQAVPLYMGPMRRAGLLALAGCAITGALVISSISFLRELAAGSRSNKQETEESKFASRTTAMAVEDEETDDSD